MEELTTLQQALKLAPILGPWLGIAVLVAMLLKSFHPILQLRREGADNEAGRLIARVSGLEEICEKLHRQATEDRQRFEDKLESQRILYEGKLEVERARHDASEALNRHKIRNLEQCLTAFFWLAEKLPATEMPRIVSDIRKMRTDQQVAEDAEKALMMGTSMHGAGGAPEPVPTPAP